ncbi:carboxypeptidase-like regulatory domain-containing protein [Clostridium bowmanii]|uniref:carboxypeptidase-like regulatory domain-containing protein n=1 Tax=Clostridium bowmanii TaxID=132925 RepID=UPI001C0B1254|nr:carboxypeptidase-like regulatory domain-containing protein [Clostridium bowmanii]MBU3190278.1 carboxypeptidase-like regulatory domain-containing protein [Clostridium bowmanii]MCA1072510.1 carboxypeptidase-like regulatory domain-containing protein [Clostridium bowmanii]
MRNNKNYIKSIQTAILVLLLMFIPIQAHAQNGDIWVNGVNKGGIAFILINDRPTFFNIVRDPSASSYEVNNNLYEVNKANDVFNELANSNMSLLEKQNKIKETVVIKAPITVQNKDQVYSHAGTYGSDNSNLTINGKVTATGKNIILQNMIIKGDLILGENIGDGDLILKNVTVEGTTIVKGGGENSVHLIDSVLATIIVNKNDGRVRLVAEGGTIVAEVQLESTATIEENNLSRNAIGFSNINITNSVQNSQVNSPMVELLGAFETINTRASQVRITLPQGTTVDNMILNAVTSIFGEGAIGSARINVGASGSILSARPQNLVFDNGSASINVNGQEISESYSSVTNASITSISEITMNSVSLNFNHFVSGLTANDFNITATINGGLVELSNINYDESSSKLTFSTISGAENAGKMFKVTVGPSHYTTKLIGEVKTSNEIAVVATGCSGRITDTNGAGAANATIKFRSGINNTTGTVAKETTTDDYGYYFISLPTGQFTGEITGYGFITGYIYVVVPSDTILSDQNETIIRTAGTSEVKIVLTWGELPYDEDSHLVGPTPDGDKFHTAFYNKEYTYIDTNYVDLDWDDMESYGPETTTIHKLVDGQYIFDVHNFSGEYSGDSSLRNSGAIVKVFKGNSATADNTFYVPTGYGNEMYWTVFKMNVSGNGSNITVTPVNEMSNTRPTWMIDEPYNYGMTPLGIPKKIKPSKVDEVVVPVVVPAVQEVVPEVVPEVIPEEVEAIKASEVTLEVESLGIAGDSTITGLTATTKYVVTDGINYYGVLSDGTLSVAKTDKKDAEELAQALTGTAITALDNAKTYKVEEVL